MVATLEFTHDYADTTEETQELLGRRWTRLRYHDLQQQFLHSTHRYNICPAGRRSGKTEIAKRRLWIKACAGRRGWRYIAAAPTYTQAKDIFWADLKALAPKTGVVDISEGRLRILLANGATIQVMGMDKPERVEGSPVGHICLDEYGNMHKPVWPEHVRPALSDPNYPGGTCDFIGVPEGRNHYYDTWLEARTKGWGAYTWFSSDILNQEEIDEAMRDMDLRTFRQEYQGSFETFAGLVYYQWGEKNIGNYTYNPDLDLVFCFDFNVEPGTASVIQEIDGKTCVIDEIWIPTNSNTPLVCRTLKEKYGAHAKTIRIFGDPAGGARGTAKVQGSDWDQIRQAFRGAYFDVPRSAPVVKSRTNAVNSRICNTKGEKRLFVDKRCLRTIKDFEGVTFKEGTNEIDKPSGTPLTHLTDGIGYYIARKFPLAGRAKGRQI